APRTEVPAAKPASTAKLPPVKIIYQDDDVMILNKPAGILSQKAQADDVSLNEYILQYLLKKGKVTHESMATFRPSVCNRLDRNTSGIVTAGITYRGARELSDMLRDRRADKRYLALVKGVLKRPAHLKGWLSKDRENNLVSIQPRETEGAQQIETEYIPLGDNGRMTLLEIHLITGKSHQIRAHLASTGHPVVGDTKYGEEQINGWYHRTYHGHFQLLHSWKLRFPADGCSLEGLAGRTFRASLPENFMRVLEGEGLLRHVNMEQPRT
ncbi:MAG: RluA family pseudouridine synthase, partial [Lachnospiraceae bacterium]|nr:RluA family pseudouridine synthase [Lachnospiraceae bacterium]